MASLLPASTHDIRAAILDVGVWELGDCQFADGREANNKLVMDRLLGCPKQLEVVLRPLGALALQHRPDALWGVPSGGQLFAEALGEELGLPVIQLEKVDTSPGRKTFRYQSEKDRLLAQQAKRLVGIEDVTTTFTSLAGAMELPLLDQKTRAITAIWRRGSKEIERRLPVPIHWLVEEYMPNIMGPYHPFRLQHGYKAVRRIS